MNDALFYLLPVMWAAIALLAARLLYTTSQAAFEGDSILGLPAKGLRLGGSVVIFVVVILLLQKVTLDSLPLRADRGKSPIDRDVLEQMRERSVRLEEAAGQLGSCREMQLSLPDCGVDLDDLKSDSEWLRNQLDSTAAANESGS